MPLDRGAVVRVGPSSTPTVYSSSSGGLFVRGARPEIAKSGH